MKEVLWDSSNTNIMMMNRYFLVRDIGWWREDRGEGWRSVKSSLYQVEGEVGVGAIEDGGLGDCVYV